MASVTDSAEARQLRKDIDWQLANIADDAMLLQRLEGVASARLFAALAWHWGPKLYARNRARFRPFILQHLSDHVVLGEGRDAKFHRIEWKPPQAEHFEAWLGEADRADDVVLFRKLYAWKNRGKRGWGLDQDRWSADLVRRFETAGTPAQRGKVLEKFDVPGTLEEAPALRLFDTDAALAKPFILRHLPGRPWRDNADRRWNALADRARSSGHDDFAWTLYRRQVPLDAWRRDIRDVAREVQDPAALAAALEQRHPDLWADLGPAFVDLLEARGTDALPYVRKHLNDTHARYLGPDSPRALAKLAQARGWTDFRIAVLVKCARPADWNAGVRDTIADAGLDDAERLRRLQLFSGVSREWNFLGWGLAAVHQLEPAVALKLYERFPALVGAQFRAHVAPAAWGEDHFALFEKAWAAGDEELADHLASRYVTRGMWRADPKELAPAERVADLLVGLRLEPGAFARRAASILTRIPAYAIHQYNNLVRHNRLARLLFERSLSDYLEQPPAVRDLVEGSEIHVQRLAYRVLSLPDARAWALARDNLDVLVGTLLRPLHRETRGHAFGALKNAARDEAAAARIATRAREAFALPDPHYAKEALLDLLAHVLALHPGLALPAEARVIHRRAA